MKIIENILKQFVEVPTNLSEITNQKIIEVDDHSLLNETTNVVIGKVLTCEKHPDADTLFVTTVDIGTETLQIVCGAPNVVEGQFVVVALVGALLPGDFLIKEATIRGVSSSGMICSLKELAIDSKYIVGEFAEGIYYFDEPQTLGSNALVALGLDGKKLELGMTPNRSDLLSHLGFAYDLAAVLNHNVNIPKPNYKMVKTKNELKIDLQTNKCYKYDASMMEVKVKESPWWLKNALIESGIRPINNIVDITNYVLITYGTPLHAFDFNKVNSKEILVREAIKGEKVVTLDEVERTLADGDILITNGKVPIALGGVMGLLNTVIDDNSTKIILEAANFSSTQILKTSKRLNLRSDSSLRFERGVDQNRVRMGMDAAIDLLVKYADAKVYTDILSVEQKAPKNEFIKTNIRTLNKKLGTKLSEKNILEIFKRLNYEVKDESVLCLKAPSYRNDIKIEADLVEELARIYGFDAIENQKLEITQLGRLSPRQKRLRNLRHLLANMGLNEVINYTLTNKNNLEMFPSIGETVKVLMPMSEDKNVLRQSIIPGLLENVSYHHARQIRNIQIFEIGHVFAKEVEKLNLGVSIEGTLVDSFHHKSNLDTNYFTLKGILDKVGNSLGVEFLVKKTNDKASLHPGIQGDIYLADEKVGLIGKVHPLVERNMDIKEVYVLELSLDKILNNSAPLVFEPVSKYPSIDRDISFVISKEYPVGDVLSMIKGTSRKLITNVELFDVYEGESLEPGMQSLAASITFNNKDKTLEKDDVEKVLKSIKHRLSFTYKAIIRD